MTTTTPQAFHYFASSALFFATGATRQEAIDKLADMTNKNTNQLLAASVKKSGGVYCWTCKVKEPETASYKIEWFAPQGVTIVDAQAFHIVNRKGDVRLIDQQQ